VICWAGPAAEAVVAVQSAVAESVFALNEGLGAEPAQQLAGDDAVLVVTQDPLDTLGGIHQAAGVLGIDGRCGFGGVP
jgi:hypothetical protein